MDARLFVLDTFTDRLFGGNPAPVVLLDGWPDDAVLRATADELGHPVVAFVVDHGERAEMRSFTPEEDLGLVGHTGLAVAWVLLEILAPGRDGILLESPVGGRMPVGRRQGLLSLAFPAMPGEPVGAPIALARALPLAIREVLVAPFGYVAITDREDDVARLEPELAAMMELERGAVIVTAPGRESDFVSRVFAPQHGLSEDPVCGTAHRIMAPYWAARLGRPELRALQLSARGGELHCVVEDDVVHIAGRAVLFYEGACRLP